MSQNNRARTNGNLPSSDQTNQQQQPPQLSEDVIRDILANQKQEIALRKEEIILRDRELQQAHELSLKNLEAQKEYMLAAPNHSFKHTCLLIISIVLVIAIFAAIFVYCIYSGNKEIAMRMMEIITTAIISGGGGFALGKNQKDKPKSPSAEIIED